MIKEVSRGAAHHPIKPQGEDISSIQERALQENRDLIHGPFRRRFEHASQTQGNFLHRNQGIRFKASVHFKSKATEKATKMRPVISGKNAESMRLLRGIHIHKKHR